MFSRSRRIRHVLRFLDNLFFSCVLAALIVAVLWVLRM
jgi:hypothetical protein